MGNCVGDQNTEQFNEDLLQKPGVKKNIAQSSYVREKFKRPAVVKMSEDAFTNEDDNAEVEIPFEQNDIEPMSRDQIKERLQEVTSGAAGKLALRLRQAS